MEKKKLKITPVEATDNDGWLGVLAILLTFVLLNGFFYYYFISVVVLREDWDTKSFPRIKDNVLNWMLIFTLLTTINYSVLYFSLVGF